MSDIAIKVENISKLYQIGEVGTGTLSHDLNRWWAKIRGNEDPYIKVGQTNDRAKRADSDFVWALKDINFEVKQGEVFGIIGRNGAGKSTLLKILSKITSPTRGKIYTKGRIASLLEVGTGFHPEMTGRENVYLNGAILGMRKWEIDNKFDEIVSFAGVEAYIDTPVKRYSSGMYVRLAFAVAAFLEPEILIVDEVLAVGDSEFQKRCLGKLENISESGRTIIFVSHTLSMVNRLCGKAIYLDNGILKQVGQANEVVSNYLNSKSGPNSELIFSNIDDAPGDKNVKLLALRVMDSNYIISHEIDISKPFYIEIEYFNFSDQIKATAVIHLLNEEGITILGTNDFVNKEWYNSERNIGVVKARCKIPGNFMTEGKFMISAAITSYNPNLTHVFEKEIISFTVFDKTSGEGARGPYVGSYWPGLIRPIFEWEIFN